MWLAAWKLVSNDAKRTVAPPNAKHSTLPQGCFFMFFVFDSIHDSATMHNLCPEIFHYFPFKHGKRRPWVVAFLDWNWYVSVITLVRVRTLVGHQDRLRLEVDRLDDHRGRLEEVRLGLVRRHGHPIGSFGWADCPLRMW